MDTASEKTSRTESTDFIRAIVAADIAAGRTKVATRFPPEPNGYIHIGHAKAICLDFGIAAENNGTCNLRMDDTNPTKEDTEYVDAIIRDIRWLGFEPAKVLYASDYFDRMYECAEKLIRDGLAYVCRLSAEEFDRDYRGTLTTPGVEPPGRRQSVEENLDLFRRMKAGEFPDGSMVLRARIDMASPNLNMRDPALYRIRRVEHFRHGNKWCIYPMYDFAHPLEDAFEGITHSLCTLEFELHRPLYDWVVNAVGFAEKPRQIEFSRLNLTNTVMSKRKLLQLVREHHVAGWDDPRMPTICGMRRRGVPAAAIRKLCRTVGITKVDGVTDAALLEHCIRETLNPVAPRFMAVQHPLKVVIVNFPDGGVAPLTAVNNPEDPAAGTRELPFGRELWIEAADFMEEPPKGYFRLAPGREVRLRYGYYIKCEEAVHGADGAITELRCTFDPETRGGSSPDGRKVKGTIHWLDAATAKPAEFRLYDRLFTAEQPGTGGADFLTQLNPASITTVRGFVESAAAATAIGEPMQFERNGYYAADPDSTAELPVFNRTVTLKDSWKPQNGKEQK